MTVYAFRMPYHDGGHDHGFYESPFFTTRKLAEDFREALIAEGEKNPEKLWWSVRGIFDATPKQSGDIYEFEVLDSIPSILPAESYRRITYT